jgi:hypothetical protein
VANNGTLTITGPSGKLVLKSGAKVVNSANPLNEYIRAGVDASIIGGDALTFTNSTILVSAASAIETAGTLTFTNLTLGATSAFETVTFNGDVTIGGDTWFDVAATIAGTFYTNTSSIGLAHNATITTSGSGEVILGTSSVKTAVFSGAGKTWTATVTGGGALTLGAAIGAPAATSGQIGLGGSATAGTLEGPGSGIALGDKTVSAPGFALYPGITLSLTDNLSLGDTISDMKKFRLLTDGANGAIVKGANADAAIVNGSKGTITLGTYGWQAVGASGEVAFETLQDGSNPIPPYVALRISATSAANSLKALGAGAIITVEPMASLSARTEYVSLNSVTLNLNGVGEIRLRENTAASNSINAGSGQETSANQLGGTLRFEGTGSTILVQAGDTQGLAVTLGVAGSGSGDLQSNDATPVKGKLIVRSTPTVYAGTTATNKVFSISGNSAVLVAYTGTDSAGGYFILNASTSVGP